MTQYQVLHWQEIPSQVKAWDDFDEIKLELSARFAARIDQAAQARGLTRSEDYLNGWVWSDAQERAGSPEEVAAAIIAELEARFAE